MEPLVETRFEELKKIPEIGPLFDELRAFQTAIFGGAVRDWLLKKTPRDIDIVVDCSAKELEFLKSFNAQKNRFGGYYLKIGGIEFDIWNLESTWAFKNDSQFSGKKTLTHLTETVFFNIDGLIYLLPQKWTIDSSFTKAMCTKILDIVYEPNPFPFLCVSKALIALVKYDLTASDYLKRYIAEQNSRGYNKKSFDKYVEMRNIQAQYDECIKKLG